MQQHHPRGAQAQSMLMRAEKSKRDNGSAAIADDARKPPKMAIANCNTERDAHSGSWANGARCEPSFDVPSHLAMACAQL